MGYDIALLTAEDDVDDELICKVCYGLLEKPRMMCAEGHTFCHGCWCQWLARKRSCPTCRGVIDEATPLIKNRIAERMIGELESFCPFRAPPLARAEKRRRTIPDEGALEEDNSEESQESEEKSAAPPAGAVAVGCEWRGRLRTLELHIETCAFALMPCKVSPLCNVRLPRPEILAHEKKCPHLRTLCVRCGRLVRVASLHHHQRSNKCHRAQTLLMDYLNLLIHTSICIADRGESSSSSSDSSDGGPGGGSSGSSAAPPHRQGRRRCGRQDCRKMEALIQHYSKCTSRDHGTCPSGVCDHVTVLVQLHARECLHGDLCPVPFCSQWRVNAPAMHRPNSTTNIAGALAAVDARPSTGA